MAGVIPDVAGAIVGYGYCHDQLFMLRTVLSIQWSLLLLCLKSTRPDNETENENTEARGEDWTRLPALIFPLCFGQARF